ncbi:hypothetical protein ATANTOWER_031461 [Ataeniobius toweri]|uniref:Uncharacterized protein n=1 Tax=Ataeniobius toweri TaxID=208326 RepID=A0ABU7BLZ9_9TELE|nr:hypothetical protein [Ataeniobius toweri]
MSAHSVKNSWHIMSNSYCEKKRIIRNESLFLNTFKTGLIITLYIHTWWTSKKFKNSELSTTYLLLIFLVFINRTFIYIWEHASLHQTVEKKKQSNSHIHTAAQIYTTKRTDQTDNANVETLKTHLAKI